MTLFKTYKTINSLKVIFNYRGYGYYFNPNFGNRLTKSLFEKEYHTNILSKCNKRNQ